MSEDQPPLKMADELQTIDAQELNAYFDRKVTNVFCEFCGSNNWLVTQESAAGSVPALPSVKQLPPHEISKPVLPLITVICEDCGFIRSFARHYVLKQIKAHKNV